jgi:hypothetical protein
LRELSGTIVESLICGKRARRFTHPFSKRVIGKDPLDRGAQA